MKTYELSRTSWHYQLAKFFEPAGVSDNFCSYFWEVVFGLLKVLSIASIAVLGLLPPLLCTYAWVADGVIPWEVHPSPWPVLFTLEVGFAVLVVLFFIASELDDWQKERQRARWDAMRKDPAAREMVNRTGLWPWEVEKEPGFLGLAYRQLKEKTCVKLVFK